MSLTSAIKPKQQSKPKHLQISWSNVQKQTKIQVVVGGEAGWERGADKEDGNEIWIVMVDGSSRE